MLTVTKSYGLYIHFPWCLQKCPYCDFLSIAATRSEIPHTAYADAVLRELSARHRQLGAVPLHSVFFGGGTPSLWKAAEVGRVLAFVREHFGQIAGPSGEECEVTAECNPTSFSLEYGRQLLEAGINRVSIGVQSLDAERLRFLGRLHDAPGGAQAVKQALEAGIPRVSADLIYGVYGQASQQACEEVALVAGLGVTHLSAYALTIEPGTQFGALHRKKQLPLLADDQVANSFNAVSSTLQDAGFSHYEVSNFAKEGARSRHNVGYWQGEPYIGVGCGAWGTLPAAQPGTQVRYRNTVVPERYLSLRDFPAPSAELTGPALPFQQLEVLGAETLLSERLMLGLRLQEGVSVSQLEQELGVPVLTPQRQKQIDRLRLRGRVELEGDRLRIPHAAWLFADGTIADLL